MKLPKSLSGLRDGRRQRRERKRERSRKRTPAHSGPDRTGTGESWQGPGFG
jgi:hypothetical protein